MPCAHFPVSATQDPRPNGHEPENAYTAVSSEALLFLTPLLTCKHCIYPQRKHPKCAEREAPYEEIQCNNSVHFLPIGSGCVRGRETESGKLKHTKGQPEDAEEAAHHHREELSLDPAENRAEEKQDGAGEEEYAPEQCLVGRQMRRKVRGHTQPQAVRSRRPIPSTPLRM